VECIGCLGERISKLVNGSPNANVGKALLIISLTLLLEERVDVEVFTVILPVLGVIVDGKTIQLFLNSNMTDSWQGRKLEKNSSH
jgi:hypothetical protein